MLPTLEYHRPTSVDEAVALLSRLDAAVPLAGGTDLVVDLRRGARSARHVVSLRDVAALRGISRDGERIRIGALATPAELAASDVVAAGRPEMREVVGAFGNPMVRNRATVGGNCCTASSCADLPPLLIACGAVVELAGPEGNRSLPLEDFFVDARRTALGPAELLVALSLPGRAPGDGAAYEPLGLRAASFVTVAGVAAWLRTEGGACREARLALGAVGPTALLVREAGEALAGRPLGEASLAAAAAAAREAARPLSDVRGSASFRKDVLEVLTRRAVTRAWERAGA